MQAGLVIAGERSPTNSAEAATLRAGQRAWAEQSVAERLAALRDLATAVARLAPQLQAALVADTGRLKASQAEVEAIHRLLEMWEPVAQDLLAETEQPSSSQADVFVRAQRVPYPLVGVITPWNSPLGLSLIDALPALIAGAAVLVKPSEVADSFVPLINQAIDQVPALRSVFRFVSGAGDTGAAVVGSVDAVCFTGSVATGRKVAVQAAERLIPAFLELGGKDPAIVLQGADLERAAGGIAWSGNFNSGQLCHSIERVYVEAGAYHAFIEHLVARVVGLTLAYPEAGDGELGPFIDPRQASIVEGQIADAVAMGARIRTGGGRFQKGDRIWLEPTILENVTHSMEIMREETFGPVLPVMKVADAAEALSYANDSVYGLSASVWGPEPVALELARQLNAGGVSVNDASLAAVLMEAEKNSFGHSGLGGSRMGPTALTRFTRSKSLLVSRIEGDDPWW